MKAIIEGREVFITFKHGEVDTQHGKRRATLCELKHDPKSDEFIAQGNAICHKKDQYTKEEGRKLALTRAVFNRDKTFRTAIWNAYLGRKPEPLNYDLVVNK